MSGSILLVDDEALIVKALSRLLRFDGYTVHQALSAREGLEILARHPVDVIISDQRMPEMMGAEFLAQVQRDYPETVRILLSGHSDFQGVVDAINNGAIYKFWSKPWDDGALRQQVRAAFIESRRLQSSRQHNRVLDMAIEAVVMTDAEGYIESANPTTETITGFNAEELLGHNYFLDCVDFEQPGQLAEIKQSIHSCGEWKGQLFGVRKNGHRFIQQLSITGFRNCLGQVVNLGILLMDITEQKEHQLRVEFLKHYEEVTDLPNRRLLSDRLTQALKHASQEGSRTAVMALDIQRYDVLKDNIGRGPAEQVLKKVVGRIQNILPDTATLACLGGDQLAILLTRVVDQKAAEQLVLSIMSRFDTALKSEGRALYLRFNIGMAIATGADANAETVLRQAEAAKAQAKAKGQSFRIYAADMDSDLREHWVLEHALPKALANNELQIVYQPKLDPKSGKIQGMEALLRWRHAELGVITPEKFIVIAEETGLIVELGKWCLYSACEQTRRWHAQGFDDLRLSVNLSACQIKDPGLYDMIESTLISLDYPPHLLELEVTESALLHDDKATLTLLRKLRSLGIGLAADDFGTGYASIDYIKRLPFSALKIDRSFVADIMTRQSDIAILDSIFLLADSLGLTVVAEGVENKEQYEFLCKRGCDLMQGYYFSKPLNIDKFSTLLAAGKSLCKHG